MKLMKKAAVSSIPSQVRPLGSTTKNHCQFVAEVERF